MEGIQHLFTSFTQQWPSYKDQHMTPLESSNKFPRVRDNEPLDSVTGDHAVFVCLHVSTLGRKQAEWEKLFVGVTVMETTVQKKHSKHFAVQLKFLKNHMNISQQTFEQDVLEN